MAARNKLCGCFSIDEFDVELPDALAPVLVFAEFYLCYDTVSFFFQGVQLVSIRSTSSARARALESGDDIADSFEKSYPKSLAMGLTMSIPTIPYEKGWNTLPSQTP